MSPVKLIGPWCSRCCHRPATHGSDMCVPCTNFCRAFRVREPDPLEELWNLESKEEGEA